MVFWGTNPMVSHPLSAIGLRKAAQAGKPLLVIDPAITDTARLAALHLRIRPGTDGLLALAFIRAFCEKEYPGFSKKETDDARWIELANSLEYDFLLSQTGISARDFFAACDVVGTHLPADMHVGAGLELKPTGVQTIRAIAWLHRRPEVFRVGCPFPRISEETVSAWFMVGRMPTRMPLPRSSIRIRFPGFHGCDRCRSGSTKSLGDSRIRMVCHRMKKPNPFEASHPDPNICQPREG